MQPQQYHRVQGPCWIDRYTDGRTGERMVCSNEASTRPIASECVISELIKPRDHSLWCVDHVAIDDSADQLACCGNQFVGTFMGHCTGKILYE